MLPGWASRRRGQRRLNRRRLFSITTRWGATRSQSRLAGPRARALRARNERRSRHSPDFILTVHLKGHPAHFWRALGHDGACAGAFEPASGGDAKVSARTIGLSARAVQFLYQAMRVRIVIPRTLSRTCIQMALVISYMTK
jgi:hypothetical protein